MKKNIFALLLIFLLTLMAACSSNSTSTNEGGSSSNSNDTNGEEANNEGDDSPIQVGAILTLTGGAGFLGESMKEAFDFQVDQINTEGGINGRPLEIIYLDDEGVPENAVRHANRLIQNDGVEVIIGPSVGATSVAIENIIEENEVLMYSLSGAYEAPANSYAFGASYSQDAMHDIIHNWAIDQGITKIGMVATNDASGNLAADIVSGMNGNDGIEYVIERMGAQDVDVTPQITKMVGEGIEAFVVVGPGAAAGVAINNANQIIPDLPIIATHSQLSESFAESIKEFIPEKMYITGVPVMAADKVSDNNPLKEAMTKFAEDYESAYGQKPEFTTAVGYDAFAIVLEGLKAVGNDGPKLKEYLENEIKDFSGAHALFNLTPEDHRGTSADGGAVLVKLNQDLSWDVAWDPYDE